MKRDERPITHCSFAAIVLVLFVCFTSCGKGKPSLRELEHLRKQCKPVIEWLDAAERKDGRYPKDLAAEHLKTLEGLPYPSRYDVSQDGQRFTIEIGDYSMPSLFVYYYKSKTKQWRIDD